MAGNKKIRTRFAPSPTGPLHIGGVRTALFCYLFAKSRGGDFMLRLEDTDKKREVAGAEKYIIDSLAWLGITPDEAPGFLCDTGYGPYRQSERLEVYRKHADLLVKSGHAYYAFETDDELKSVKDAIEKSGEKNKGYTRMFITPGMKNSFTMSQSEVDGLLASGTPYVIRFLMPYNKKVSFDDRVRGVVEFNTENLDDKVLFKSDGFPTYHLANVVDDHLMEITHVIRGEEWLPSTPLHVLLYEAFGWSIPDFAHLPSVLGPDGKKLSKRHADKYGFPIFPLDWTYVNDEGREVSVLGFKEAGYRVDALLNFIALLGWSPGGDMETMTLSEMSKLFSLSRVSKGGAMFDFDKLKYFNSHYLRTAGFDELLKFIDTKSVKYSKDKLVRIMDIAKERAVFESELNDRVSYFFEEVRVSKTADVKNAEHFSKFADMFLTTTGLDVAFETETGVKAMVEGACLRLDIKPGAVMPGLRMALTGGKPGPELPLTMWLLGRIESEKRMKNLVCALSAIDKTT
jgi:glutamyl-tRNA synthetase